MRLLKQLVEALFRVLFVYDCEDEEKIPAEGPAVVAANHPSYLDPILLSLQATRPIRFMAWDALFKVPVLGALMRAFGAFPVDVRPGQGREAYARAKALVEQGEVVGIFPEGRRSATGWMEPKLREGAARLAWETGAPLVPASIVGAWRAWPYFSPLPRPGRIRVRYHDPIDPRPYRTLPEEEALPALLAELRKRVERTLLPGVKADLRLEVVYRAPAPFPRSFETLPALAAALLVFWKTRAWLAVLPAYLYLAYLLLDHLLIPQSRTLKQLRNGSVALFALGYGPVVLESLGLPVPRAADALGALLLGALFPYLYERSRPALGFMRGLVLAAGCEAVALRLFPTDLGPHVALPLFAAAYAWEERTVFWGWSAPILATWALGIPWLLAGRLPLVLVPHAIAGLLAWLVTWALPYRLRSRSPEEPPPETGLGLGLR